MKSKHYCLTDKLGLSEEYIYTIVINNETFCYFSNKDEAMNYSNKLMNELLTELNNKYNSKYYKIYAVKNVDKLENIKVYKQALGYIYNSDPEQIYNITVSELYRGIIL